MTCGRAPSWTGAECRASPLTPVSSTHGPVRRTGSGWMPRSSSPVRRGARRRASAATVLTNPRAKTSSRAITCALSACSSIDSDAISVRLRVVPACDQVGAAVVLRVRDFVGLQERRPLGARRIPRGGALDALLVVGALALFGDDVFDLFGSGRVR